MQLAGCSSPASTLGDAVQQMLVSYRASFGARPVAVFYLPYSKKIAVVVEFDRMIYCPCGPTYHGVGGRVIVLV